MGKMKGIAALSAGRPPEWRKQSASLSSKVTRNIIRQHHELEKARAQAVRCGDDSKVRALEDEITRQGGIVSYQRASILGQSAHRGGDSSKVLVHWLKEAGIPSSGNNKYRMLEIGALSTENACSRSGMFAITRIDLNAQSPGIQKQDFMERPTPAATDEEFDIISLSLVLNYVPTPQDRGDMLRRTCMFMQAKERGAPSDGIDKLFPSLFLVLPTACTSNSRYFSETRLDEIMNSLGYVQARHKTTKKLSYSLWTYSASSKSSNQSFKKVVIHDGKQRNNFCITLQCDQQK